VTPLAQIVPGAPGLQIPAIPWAAISPELVLFGFGILVLLLYTAGEQKLQASFVTFGVLAAGAGVAAWQTDQVLLAALVGLAGAAQFALTAIWQDRPRMLAAILTALGFAGGLGVTVWQWVERGGAEVVGTQTLLVGMFAVDGVALFTRVTVCVAGLVTVPLGFAYLEDRRIHRGEYYPLLLFAATGMTLLAASADLLMVFIAIEVLSLALYILSGFAKRDMNSQEAALKYFILGSFASAILLYGIALVYGLAGTTNIAAAGRALASADAPVGLSLAAMSLLLVGFAFKASLVPFHMWTPDVYQGAPTPVTGFMAATTKAAAFAAFIRVFVGGFGGLQWTWLPVVWVLAAVTMLVGAVLAVVQSDLKRMLAYSAITHAGYALIGMMAVSREGISATLLYLLIYAVMSLGSFGVLSLLERRDRKAMGLDDLRGLGRRHPVPAAMLALFLLSLAGIPGTAGFVAKFAVFRAAVQTGLANGDGWLYGIVVLGVVSSMIAAFFYIRVIVMMFMEDPVAEVAGAEVAEMPLTYGVQAALAASAAAMVALGILPGVLIDLARQAASLAG
jgi:NADH-quinone oxidoreductase subunit N